MSDYVYFMHAADKLVTGIMDAETGEELVLDPFGDPNSPHLYIEHTANGGQTIHIDDGTRDD